MNAHLLLVMNVRLSLLLVEYLVALLLHPMNDVVLKLSYQSLHLQYLFLLLMHYKQVVQILNRFSDFYLQILHHHHYHHLLVEI